MVADLFALYFSVVGSKRGKVNKTYLNPAALHIDADAVFKYVGPALNHRTKVHQ